MSKYGAAAVLAARQTATEPFVTPLAAWEAATKAIFPESRSSQRKGCPRASFLALCEIGAVKGVQLDPIQGPRITNCMW